MTDPIISTLQQPNNDVTFGWSSQEEEDQTRSNVYSHTSSTSKVMTNNVLHHHQRQQEMERLKVELQQVQKEAEESKNRANRLALEHGDLVRAVDRSRQAEKTLRTQAEDMNAEISSLQASIGMKMSLKTKSLEEVKRTSEQRRELERTWQLLGGKKGLELLEASRRQKDLDFKKRDAVLRSKHIDDDTERNGGRFGHNLDCASVASASTHSFTVRDLFERHRSRRHRVHGIDDANKEKISEEGTPSYRRSGDRRSSWHSRAADTDQDILSVQACLWDEDKSTAVPTAKDEVETTEEDWNDDIERLRQRRESYPFLDDDVSNLSIDDDDDDDDDDNDNDPAAGGDLMPGKNGNRWPTMASLKKKGLLDGQIFKREGKVAPPPHAGRLNSFGVSVHNFMVGLSDET